MSETNNMTDSGSPTLPCSPLLDPAIAPKDGSRILGAFGWPWLLPAVWCEYAEAWVTVTDQPEKIHGKISRGWEMETEKSSALLGWIPMPELPEYLFIQENSEVSRL